MEMEPNVLLVVGDEGNEVLRRLTSLKSTSNASNSDSCEANFISLDTRYYTARVSVVSLSFDEAAVWLARAQDSEQRISSIIFVFRPNSSSSKGFDEWDLLHKLQEINSAVERAHGTTSDSTMKVFSFIGCLDSYLGSK